MVVEEKTCLQGAAPRHSSLALRTTTGATVPAERSTENVLPLQIFCIKSFNLELCMLLIG